MSDPVLTKAIKDAAIEMNADFIGIADPSCFLNPDYLGNRPQEIMPGLRSVIVLGVGIPRGAFEPLPKGGRNIPIPSWLQLQP